MGDGRWDNGDTKLASCWSMSGWRAVVCTLKYSLFVQHL